MTKPEENIQQDTVDVTDEHKELIEEEVLEGTVETDASAGETNIESMTPEQLLAETQRALDELDKAKDANLRTEAEMQNVRRRAEREVEHAVKYGIEKLVQNLLPVVDSLEKAIESAEQAGSDDAATAAIIEGMGLCRKLFGEVLEKEGMVTVDPQGEPFDPNLHQAISMVENPDMEPNSVVAVVQKGYQLNGRLVRPAMVMVSKGGAPSGPSIDEKA